MHVPAGQRSAAFRRQAAALRPYRFFFLLALRGLGLRLVFAFRSLLEPSRPAPGRSPAFGWKGERRPSPAPLWADRGRAAAGEADRGRRACDKCVG